MAENPETNPIEQALLGGKRHMARIEAGASLAGSVRQLNIDLYTIHKN